MGGFVRVGVTGHRNLDRVVLDAPVRDALVLVTERYAPASRLEVVSCLAEGADRIVAWAVLTVPGASLTVALPLPAEEYARDFSTPDSRAEFEGLLSRATRVEVMAPAAVRDEAYRQAGRWVAEHCDVLVALWDGAPSQGRGGTAEIVAYARERGVPVCWIHTQGAPFTEII